MRLIKTVISSKQFKNEIFQAIEHSEEFIKNKDDYTLIRSSVALFNDPSLTELWQMNKRKIYDRIHYQNTLKKEVV